MSKIKKQVNKAKKLGMSNADLLRMREIAKKEAKKMETEATERSFLYMLAIPLNVLFNDYWQKTAKKKAPRFIEDCCSLYEAVQQGVVTDRQLADFLQDMAGITIEAEWLNNKQ